MEKIPTGHTRAEIKSREKLIMGFYSRWITEHPGRKVWNRNMSAYIYVKFISFNETVEKASRSYESTLAVLNLTEILEKAEKIGEQPAKKNVQNQKRFEKMIIMKYGNVKLTVGLQRSCQEFVQYCVTVPSNPNKNKTTTEK
ncbi:MAG: hypothetical protein K6F96_07385 [Bacteroidales bacterium]|nr:hypothetical protein [Bacteroidales bacterium]